MFGYWRVDGYLEEVWIVAPFSGAKPPASAKPVDPIDACLRAERWFPDEWLTRRTLLEIVSHVDRMVGVHAASAPRSWLVERVADALRRRSLEAYVVQISTAGSGGSRAVVAPAPANDAPFKPNRDEPPSTTWIGLKLVDQTGAPLGGRRYRVETSDGATRTGMLGPTGIALVQGLEPGTCRVFCPDYEQFDGRTYVVKAGEHLADIAERFGYEQDETVWNNERNSDLRKLRPNPYVLADGDELYLPERTPKAESKSTGAEHLFTLQTTRLKLKLIFEIFNGKAIDSEPSTVTPAPLDAPKMTGGNGDVELTIARSSHFFQIALGGYESELHVGRLDPISEDTGVNARLVNLGYLHGAPEDADGDELALAVEEFQADAQLLVTGTIDEATRNQLVVMHGS
jgi:N-acetylmuramoyl-L-alanine amidase